MLKFDHIITNGYVDIETILSKEEKGWTYVGTFPAKTFHPHAMKNDKLSLFSKYEKPDVESEIDSDATTYTPNPNNVVYTQVKKYEDYVIGENSVKDIIKGESVMGTDVIILFENGRVDRLKIQKNCPLGQPEPANTGWITHFFIPPFMKVLLKVEDMVTIKRLFEENFVIHRDGISGIPAYSKPLLDTFIKAWSDGISTPAGQVATYHGLLCNRNMSYTAKNHEGVIRVSPNEWYYIVPKKHVNCHLHEFVLIELSPIQCEKYETELNQRSILFNVIK